MLFNLKKETKKKEGGKNGQKTLFWSYCEIVCGKREWREARRMRYYAAQESQTAKKEFLTPQKGEKTLRATVLNIIFVCATRSGTI